MFRFSIVRPGIRRYFSSNTILWPGPHTKHLAFNTMDVHQELQERHKNDPPGLQPIVTGPRTAIMNILLSRLKSGSHGRFAKQTNVLIGVKGIGKSTVLKQIQSVSRDLHPRLLVTYVDLSQSLGKLENVSPFALLKRMADEEDVSYPEEYMYNRIEPILEELAEANFRVALLYDETERLYDRDCPEGREFINDLQVLANTSYRNAFTLLCGNSVALPLLVSNAALHDPVLSRKFTLKASDLNSSKFSTIRIPPKLSVQDIVNTINVYIPMLESDKTEKLARLLSFRVGNSLQLCCTILESVRDNPDKITDKKITRFLSTMVKPTMSIINDGKK